MDAGLLGVIIRLLCCVDFSWLRVLDFVWLWWICLCALFVLFLYSVLCCLFYVISLF